VTSILPPACIRDLAYSGDPACTETLSTCHIKLFLYAVYVISNALLQDTFTYNFVETVYAMAYFCTV